MTSASRTATAGRIAHESRVVRRLEARGERGLGDALLLLDGTVLGNRYRIESLYAVGSEGAVYLCRDVADASAPVRVAKVPLLPLHRPFDLTDDEIRRRRDSLREEAANLAGAASLYLPRSLGLFEFTNPALEADWGGEFGAPEPALVMEKIPGFDLDVWLARMHRSDVPRDLLRRQLDHVVVVVLSGLMDLQDRGFFYTDLRPGNVRIRGRTRERVRLLDAGSLVGLDDRSGKFPHVPAYLPPALFEASRKGEVLLPSAAVQAVMAGRTLFEVATGHVPLPGEDVDTATLAGPNVSPSVAETIARLCTGEFADVTDGLAYLSERFMPERDDRIAKPRRPQPAPQPAPRPQPQQMQRPAPVAPPPARDLRSALARAKSTAPSLPASAVPLAQASSARVSRTSRIDEPMPGRKSTVRSPSERNLQRLFVPPEESGPPATRPAARPAPAAPQQPPRSAASAAVPRAAPQSVPHPVPKPVPRAVAQADTETATMDAAQYAAQFRDRDDAILPLPAKKGWFARLLDAIFRRG